MLAYENLFSCIQAGFGAIDNLQDAIAVLDARIDHMVEGIEGCIGGSEDFCSLIFDSGGLISGLGASVFSTGFSSGLIS